MNTGYYLLGKHLKRFNILDSDICKLCSIGIHDREHLSSSSALQDELDDIDNFENMTKAEKESVCYWLARSMMAKRPTTGISIIIIMILLVKLFLCYHENSYEISYVNSHG
jgi:hypothetical protein